MKRSTVWLTAISVWLWQPSLWLTVPSDLAMAQPSVPTVASEAHLKLARLYATVKFISWPDDGVNAPFVITVIGPDPFAGGLQKLANRKVRDRLIRVVMAESEINLEPCHLLFIARDAKSELVEAVLKQVMSRAVLIWKDLKDLPDAEREPGVCCAFVRDGDSLLIEADPAEMKRRRLVPDGQLLSLNLVRVVKPPK